VTYVGTLPDRPLAVALAHWLRPGPDPWEGRPGSVTATSARDREGRRLWFVSNWSWEPAAVTLPMGMGDVVSGAAFRRSGDLDLGPWDVRVLRESPGEESNREGS